MMTDRLLYNITLTVRSPFLFRGLEGSAFGIDAPCLRDERGRPIIPADQIRGVLREALGDLANAGAGVTDDDIGKIFGKSSDDKQGQPGLSNEPNRSAIEFADLTALNPLPDAGETTRIEIDDETGAVKDGMLQVIELAAPFCQTVRFTGTFVLFRPQDQARHFERLLNQALALVASIGAFKSPGFGEVVEDASTITFAGAKPLTLPAAVAGDGGLYRRFRLRFDRPVLVDGEKIAANAVLGSAIIPGSVIKGALAQRLERAGLSPGTGPLGQALAGLSISHAFPESEEAGRPCLLPLPLSLVAAEDEKGAIRFGDALMVPLGEGAMIAGAPVLFSDDWKPKYHSAFDTQYPDRPKGEEPPGLARTHTGINSQTGIAEDQRLFTTIARSVLHPDGTARTWLLDVDLDGLDQDLARRMIAALLADGLDGIGKTAAHVDFEEITPAAPPEPRPVHGHPNQYAVVLTTPTLMLDAVALTNGDGTWTQEPMAAYQDYWDTVLPGARLVNFYARQQFRGGYLARRRRLYGPQTYHPFLLTLPGSVFRVETTNLDGLRRLCRAGLPLPRLTGTVDAPGWWNCPYVPENGYGRITADHLSTADAFALTQQVDHV